MTQPETLTIDGSVERIVHVVADGTTIARLTAAEPGASPATIAVAGLALEGVQPGETVRITGQWRASHRYGNTFRVQACEQILPASVHAIRCYLGSGLIKGIGVKFAQAIVDHFGTETLTVIDQSPHRLLEVEGIGPVRLEKITTGWAEQRATREAMIILQGVGASLALASRIHHEFGSDTMRIVQDEPYTLIDRVHGIGFKKADAIAKNVGIPEHSLVRLQAALLYTLDEQRANTGHCFSYYSSLLAAAAEEAEQPAQMLVDPLHRLRDERRVVIEHLSDEPDGVVVYPAWLHRAELAVADHITRLMRGTSSMPPVVRRHLASGTLGERGGIALDERQRAAVSMALTTTVSVLTGGPGCGKSFTVGAIAAAARAGGATIALTAPTGRAAQRLTELTCMPAHTIHRLVYGRRDAAQSGELFTVGDALAADLVIVDEASMVDVSIAAKFLAEIPTGCHLLWVGDVDQLPSVGPGRVLADLLDSDRIPRTCLTTIYRQGPGSRIAQAAHQVLRGYRFTNSAEVWFVAVDDQQHPTLVDLVVDMATRLVPTKQNVSPSDVQVLCPSKRSVNGATVLSRTIQDVLNPHQEGQPEYWADDRPFRIGDKVMPIRNDYRRGERGVFNGSVGTITDIDLTERRLRVLLDDQQTALYDFDELDQLAHGYAITVHRSQGSEYPYVVIPLSRRDPYILLRRNLLYTALTRAKKAVIIVGHERALSMVLGKPTARRNTRLTARLAERLVGPALVDKSVQLPVL